MKHPQTTAVQFSEIKNLPAIAKYGCCAMVALWCLGIEPDNEIDTIKILDEAIEKGVLDKDCTVNWIPFLKFVTGRTFDIEFKNISSIKSITKRTPVRYDYNGYSHWVGVENGSVKYNPLINSVCVAKGKPSTARIIILNGKQI